MITYTYPSLPAKGLNNKHERARADFPDRLCDTSAINESLDTDICAPARQRD
jgi:hypothetical protein